MNSELEKISNWLQANKLTLNVSKTHYMTFHTRKNKPAISQNLYINGAIIQSVEHSKFLGVYIDSCLSWDRHIGHVKTKIARGIGIINKAKQVFNIPTLTTLYYSFIYPYLSYCIEVWGKAAAIHLNSLFKLQKRVVKNIRSVPIRTESDPIFRQLGILRLSDIYRYQVITFMFKFIKGMLPDMFDDMFTRNSSVIRRVTRQQHKLAIPRCRTTAFQKTLRFTGVQEWNEICDTVDHFCSVHTLKKRVKTYIISL